MGDYSVRTLFGLPTLLAVFGLLLSVSATAKVYTKKEAEGKDESPDYPSTLVSNVEGDCQNGIAFQVYAAPNESGSNSYIGEPPVTIAFPRVRAHKGLDGSHWGDAQTHYTVECPGIYSFQAKALTNPEELSFHSDIRLSIEVIRKGVVRKPFEILGIDVASKQTGAWHQSQAVGVAQLDPGDRVFVAIRSYGDEQKNKILLRWASLVVTANIDS